MEYRYLGRTGLKVSELCLGTMLFGHRTDEPTAHRMLDTFVEPAVTARENLLMNPALVILGTFVLVSIVVNAVVRWLPRSGAQEAIGWATATLGGM
jgi:hypothetical protein